ncbi:MAG: hypothetical protein C4519_25730 [Desulfobacteraceae bacterium]|nr:MAG: hypothetical protein C4519_25730 [Desulfobacteraceae bacterium]
MEKNYHILIQTLKNKPKISATRTAAGAGSHIEQCEVWGRGRYWNGANWEVFGPAGSPVFSLTRRDDLFIYIAIG